MDKEMQEFQDALLRSIRDMKAGKAAGVTKVDISPVAQARNKVGMVQADFAKLMGVSVRTLQEWEQGRRSPSGAAKTLLQVAIRHPEALRDLNHA